MTSKSFFLVLLSSMLVTPEESSRSRRKKETDKTQDPQDVQDIVELLSPSSPAPAPAEPLSPPSDRLDYKWTLWYDKQNPKGFLNKQAYLKELTKGDTFDTIAGFWKAWLEVQSICLSDDPDVEYNYQLFKEGITPTWEDSKNRKGGKWVIMLPKGNIRDVLKLWTEFMLDVLHDEFGITADICGMVFSVRPWGNLFTLWNRSSKNVEQVEQMQAKLKEYFKLDEIKYKPHTVTLKKHHTEKKGLVRSRSSSVSSDSSCSEGEAAGSRKPRSRRGSRASVNQPSHSLLRDLLNEMHLSEGGQKSQSLLVRSDSESDFEAVPTNSPPPNNEEETKPHDTLQLEALSSDAEFPPVASLEEVIPPIAAAIPTLAVTPAPPVDDLSISPVPIGIAKNKSEEVLPEAPAPLPVVLTTEYVPSVPSDPKKKRKQDRKKKKNAVLPTAEKKVDVQSTVSRPQETSISQKRPAAVEPESSTATQATVLHESASTPLVAINKAVGLVALASVGVAAAALAFFVAES